jgi:hypothetical protein
MMRELEAIATEFVAYRVGAQDYDGSAIDLSSDTVKIAFVAVGSKPATADWHTATWVSTGVAGVLVGSDNGGTPLAVGLYDVWLQVLDSQEHPTRPVDTLRIT